MPDFDFGELEDDSDLEDEEASEAQGDQKEDTSRQSPVSITPATETNPEHKHELTSSATIIVVDQLGGNSDGELPPVESSDVSRGKYSSIIGLLSLLCDSYSTRTTHAARTDQVCRRSFYSYR
jgi:hypothetical protein